MLHSRDKLRATQTLTCTFEFHTLLSLAFAPINSDKLMRTMLMLFL